MICTVNEGRYHGRRSCCELLAFMGDAVWHRDIAAIGDCMTALDRFPGGMLRCAKLLLFRRMPADCCGIKNNLCAVQRRQARRFRIPLVPADANANLAACCWPRL